MSADRCTTHHLACDCREAKFANAIAKLEAALKAHEALVEELKVQNAALSAALETSQKETTCAIIDWVKSAEENERIKAWLERCRELAKAKK